MTGVQTCALPIFERVRAAQERGEKTILISASLQEDVEKVGAFLNIFDECIGSRDQNLKGRLKLQYLQDRGSGASITYVGDSTSDLEIWSHSQKIVAINPGSQVRKRISELNAPSDVISDKKNTLSLLLRQMRVHQWLKNLLVFAPVFLAHKFQELSPWIQTSKVFFGFSFLASAVYVFNDLCDLKSDRKQESKRNRPLASGQLSLGYGMLLVPFCLLLSLFIVSPLPKPTWGVLGGYLLMNFIYSFWVKEWLALDVIFLSIFYFNCA